MRWSVAPWFLALGVALAGSAGAQIPSTAPRPLYDRVAPLADIPSVTAETRVGSVRFLQMVDELERAAEGPAREQAARIREAAGEAAREGLVPVGLLASRVDRLTRTGREAVSRGDVTLATGERETMEVFAASVLTGPTYRGRSVQLVFGDAWSYGLDRPVALQVDPGDGQGWRTASWEVPLTVSYDTTGPKTLRVRGTRADGSSQVATTGLLVLALATPDPDDTLQVSGAVPYLGGVASGEAYVLLAPGHAQLTDPILVVEGFDLDNSLNWDELYALLNTESLLDSLLARGFDAVVLNFDEATDYIQRNGELTVSLIQEVQSRIGPATTLAVVGASMGGLVGRYALAAMEDRSQSHRVRTFISFDSPQNGANIPLGIQYWLDFFSDQSAEAQFLLSRLDTPAARQMLVYHHTSPPQTNPTADPLRAQLDAEFAALGDYPAQPRLVAVANGSGSMAGQGFNAGAQIIEYEYRSWLVDITGNVWAVPDGGSKQILQAEIDFLFLPADQLNVTVSGTLPYDNAPGGSRDSMADMDSVQVSEGDIRALYPSHCFIPTVSALDLATGNLFHDIVGDPNLASLTPFDAVYFPAANQEHVLITPENAGWFVNELSGSRTGVSGTLPPARLTVSPNPVVHTAVVRFATARAGDVRVQILDVLGRRVAEPVRGRLEAGTHEVVWDGRNARGANARTGVYFVRVETPEGVESARLVRLR